MDDAAAAEQYGDLTTVGRTSGQARTVEMWFAAEGRTVYLLAGSGEETHWVRNLVANPAVTIRVDDRTYAGRGRLITDADEDLRARDALVTKYRLTYPGDLTDWRDTAVPVAIDLETDA